MDDARDDHQTGSDGASTDGESDPFDVERPDRRVANGSVEYVGETIFALRPDGDEIDDHESVVATALGADRYVAGDWFDLPATVYLVHDTATTDVARVAVRSDRIELHALPNTGVETLQALRNRLANAAETTLSVESIATPD